ncbi:rod shape-determining protein RodA [Listeria seeligeri]|uniref:rod shape-determining protein RodA n=1 Tax=Listeria seeligeri TaxID=1640 RepID=UPI0022EB0E77|nr:rod shape-determining protein RodA [Listeria seeligeri]
MARNRKKAVRVDYAIIFLMMLLCIIGLVAIYVAGLVNDQYTNNFLLQQSIWIVISTGVVFVIVLFFDYDKLQWAAYYLYGLGNLLLVLVLIVGDERKGSKSWISIGSLGSLQPSELMKSFLILALAKVIWDHNKKYQLHTIKMDIQLLLKVGIISIIPLGLVALQPDLGTILVFIAIIIGMVFISGVTWKILVPLFSAITVIGATLIYLVLYNQAFLQKLGFEPYQFKRITSWLRPEEDPLGDGMQLLRSMQAIGSGQLQGNGIGNQAIAIPENHNDFIFSIIGGNFGFIGGCLLIMLYFLLIYQIIRVALDIDIPFYSYICAGVCSMILFHVLENIGMTIGLLPITGIPLLFVSYGGSSLLGAFMALGLVLSARYNAPEFNLGKGNRL